MKRVNGFEWSETNTDVEKVAAEIAGEETTNYVIDADVAEKKAAKEAIDELNAGVRERQERLREHESILSHYKETLLKDLGNLEIKPFYEGVLIKPFEPNGLNPFQEIEYDENGFVLNYGGLANEYRSQEDGRMHQEEQALRWGLVQEVGPTCNFAKPGDVVMWIVHAQIPVPFYNQGLVLVNEHSLKVVVNQGLNERKHG